MSQKLNQEASFVFHWIIMDFIGFFHIWIFGYVIWSQTIDELSVWVWQVDLDSGYINIGPNLCCWLARWLHMAASGIGRVIGDLCTNQISKCICKICYIDLSNLLHIFVSIAKYICLSCACKTAPHGGIWHPQGHRRPLHQSNIKKHLFK